MGAALAGLGLVMGAGGAYLGGQAGDIARRRLKKAANMPGLDIDKVTGESLDIQGKYLPKAGELASQISKLNQENLMAQEEAALPGAAASRQTALAGILNMFQDDEKWLSGLKRRGAALGVGSGLFGSQAGQIGTLRLSDRESMQRTQMGTGLLGQLLSTLNLAGSPNIQSFLPSTSGVLSQRSAERATQQQMLGQAAGIPGQTGAWANYLTSTGGMLTGAGMGMMGGGQQSPSMGGYGGMTIPDNFDDLSTSQQIDYANLWKRNRKYDTGEWE